MVYHPRYTPGRSLIARFDDAPPRPGRPPVFSYAHPIFWAPFALIGDGG